MLKNLISVGYEINIGGWIFPKINKRRVWNYHRGENFQGNMIHTKGANNFISLFLLENVLFNFIFLCEKLNFSEISTESDSNVKKNLISVGYEIRE